jgi:hypothetical protein
MTEPIQVGELLPGVLQEVIDRAGPDYDRWMEQVAATGYCAHPVRLRGTVDHADRDTGEVELPSFRGQVGYAAGAGDGCWCS